MPSTTPRIALLGVTLLALACGPPPAPIPASGTREDTGPAVAAFQLVEDEVLRDLSAIDRRVAARAHIEPREEDLRRVTMGALLAEDATIAVVDGAIDPFSFEARARGLTATRAKLDGAPATLPTGSPGPMALPALEKELLARLVDAERVRLDEERALPRSASALVRAVVETWKAPTTPQEAAERDRWLTRRLAEVLGAVTGIATRSGGPLQFASAPLDVVRARELDDALDALEHAIDAAGLAHATVELVKLREALEAQGTRPAAGPASSWNEVARGLKAHLGIAVAPEVLDARLTALETELRGAAQRAIAGAHVSADVVGSRASPLVLAAAPCAVAIPGSRIRSMTAPPERAAACRLGRIVTLATDDTARAAALVAMHDHVTVARWAFDVARGTATIAQTTGRHRPLSIPGPDVIAKWERVALAQPSAAIGGGLAAGILYGGGETEARARAWSELGDLPIDLADRELSREAHSSQSTVRGGALSEL